MLLTWPSLSQVSVMLSSPGTCFKAGVLVQVPVWVLWQFLSCAPPIATPVAWAVSFLEFSALEIALQLLSLVVHLSASYHLGHLTLAGKALGQDSFWNGITMMSSGQVSTPLLTCVGGECIFFPATEFFSSTQATCTFSSVIVLLQPFNYKIGQVIPESSP